MKSLLKGLLAAIFNGLADIFDRLAMACEAELEEMVQYQTTTNGHMVASAERKKAP